MIEALNLRVQRGERRVLDAVGFSVQRGELLGLTGPNGAGKSTLLRVMAGIQPHTGGLTLDGQALAQMPGAQRARRIGYLEQGGHSHWPIPVRRLVELGRLPRLTPWQAPDPRDAEVVQRVLQQTDLQDLADRPFDSLSGGERARALIARALAGEPELLLADEPVAALDPAHQLLVMRLFRDHCAAGGAGIIALHELRLASAFCHRILLLHEGRTAAVGEPRRALSAVNLERVYGLRLIKDARGPLELGWGLASDREQHQPAE